MPFNLSNVHFNTAKCKIIYQQRKKIVDHVYKGFGNTLACTQWEEEKHPVYGIFVESIR